jgi:asparagine synthase (glutamine-hydrolysing)
MSREVKFIMPFLVDLDVDKTALADYLLFGYSLGDRTLWKDIRRLPPATMILTNVEKKGLVMKKTLSWNLDPRSCENKNSNSLHEKTSRLVDLFTGSLKGIADRFSEEYTHIVSLSGGLDSRATLAGLRQIGIRPIACSYPSREIRIAKETARALKVNHHTISSSYEISDEDYVELTDGLLDIGLRPLFLYIYGIREKAGNKAILYTGDGGDKTLSPLHFRSSISNLRELVSYIIEVDHIFDPDEVSSMLNINESDLRAHLENHVMSYPEDTMEGKFLHFKVFERGFKWLFVGEDRNRFILWSTTPFYSIRFFTSSTKESQSIKEHYVLYKDFLLNLNPVLVRIPYYNRLIPLSTPNWLLKLYLTAFEWLKRQLYVQGASNPITTLVGEPTQQILEKTRKKILRLLSQKDVFDFLDSSRISRQILSEKNQMKLNILSTFILHASLATDSNPPKTSANL